MPGNCYQMHGVRVFECAGDGPTLRNSQDATTFIGEAIAHQAELIVIQTGRLHPDFFELRTRVAGEFLQTFVNYRLRVAILGNISGMASKSEALRALIQEMNRGDQVWFLPEMKELEKQLAQRNGRVS